MWLLILTPSACILLTFQYSIDDDVHPEPGHGEVPGKAPSHFKKRSQGEKRVPYQEPDKTSSKGGKEGKSKPGKSKVQAAKKN